MKILFIGLGSIGKKHAGLLNEHFKHDLYAYRTSGNPMKFNGVTNLYRWTDVFSLKPDVAFICNPTHKHIETAIDCAKLGMHLFIEKPLGVNAENLDELEKIVRNRGISAYVAYPFRFNDKITALRGKTYSEAVIVCRTDITKWGKGYSRKKSTGGGALLELSHEIDLAQHLFGEIVDLRSVFRGNRGIFTDAETYISLISTHANGFQTTISLDIGAKCDERYISLGNFAVNYRANDEMYLRQLRYFFANLGGEMQNNLVEAGKLFRKITKIA